MIMAACLALAATGCGEVAQRGTVFGRVTYQGQPVPLGCRVVFVNRHSGHVAFGSTSAGGMFELLMDEEPGVVVGEYCVGVVPPLTPDSWSLSPQQYRELYESMASAGVRGQEWKEIPEKYRAAETSGETFTVRKGDNEYTLDMKIDETNDECPQHNPSGEVNHER
jgi:hypothetical protein